MIWLIATGIWIGILLVLGATLGVEAWCRRARVRRAVHYRELLKLYDDHWGGL